jgi:hypothetical protein
VEDGPRYGVNATLFPAYFLIDSTNQHPILLRMMISHFKEELESAYEDESGADTWAVQLQADEAYESAHATGYISHISP